MHKTVIAIAFLFVPFASQGASFDCSKATTNVEELICQDTAASRTVSELDSVMSDVYAAKLTDAPDPGALKREQRRWLNNVRNKCLDVSCLETAYTQRIEQLTDQDVAVEQRVLAHGGRYEVLMGKGVEVCEGYAANLNSFKPYYPMLCDRSVNPRFSDLKKPKWQRLDFEKNLELIVSIDRLLRPTYFRQPEIRVPSLRGNVEQDNYRYQVTIVDIDNDGKTEPVLRFVEACWDGSPRLGGSALVVLQKNRREVDIGKSQLISNAELRNYSGGMRDVFLHRGKTYFDIWFFNLANSNQLHVMLTENAETRAICKLEIRSGVASQ